MPVSYSRIVAFGDSLSSAGRGKNGPSTGPEPTPANGNLPRQTWVQQLSEMLGLGPLAKWEIGGSNYAVGGSTTEHLREQVTRYLAANGDRADPAALHTVWSGSNDLGRKLRDRYRADGVGVLFRLESLLTESAEQAVDTLEREIARLIEAGATRILWVNLPDLSRTPSLLARVPSFPGIPTLAKRAFRNASDTFNRRMLTAVDRLRAAHPEVDLVTADAHAFFEAIMANPGAYGFTDVKTPSRVSSQHLFYDHAHPTTRGHRAFALVVRDVLTGQARTTEPVAATAQPDASASEAAPTTSAPP